MKTWAESKQMPGQFTGSTGVKVLSAAELTSGYQTWARKVIFYVLLTSSNVLLLFSSILNNYKKKYIYKIQERKTTDKGSRNCIVPKKKSRGL